MKKMGLALGSGALRGMAHIGVLQVLDEHGIRPDFVAGTSIGAVVGGVYACGVDMNLMARMVVNLNERDYYDVTLPRMGLIKGARVHALLRTLTGGRAFADTRVPFKCVATDMITGEAVALDEGPLHEAIRASISIPGVFVPHTINGRAMVDGAVADRLPVSVVRDMGAQVVVAVDVAYRGAPVEPRNIAEVIMHATEIMEWECIKARRVDAEVVIVPDVKDINPSSLAEADVCIEAGRAAALAAVEDIKALLA